MSNQQYIKFPVWLLSSGLSARAMVLYAIIADRIASSEKIGLVDDKGTYCYYTVQEIEQKLSISHSTAQRTVKELENQKLISRVRPKGNRTQAFKIYLSEVSELTPHEVSELTPHEVSELTPHEVSDSTPKSDKNKQNRIYTSSSSGQTKQTQTHPEDDDPSESHENKLTGVILRIAPDLDIDAIQEIKRRLQKRKKIYNVAAYLRTVIKNYRLEQEATKSTGKSYEPSYDIQEYERYSVLDEDDWDD